MAWAVCKFKGGACRKRVGMFLRGVDTPMHTMYLLFQLVSGVNDHMFNIPNKYTRAVQRAGSSLAICTSKRLSVNFIIVLNFDQQLLNLSGTYQSHIV